MTIDLAHGIRTWVSPAWLAVFVGCGACAPRDRDEDAYEQPSEDRDGDGWFTPADCDDGDPLVNPGGVDACVDGRRADRDCNPDFMGMDDFFIDGGVVDLDGDGWGAFMGWPICATPPGPIVTLEGDCDDDDPGVNPDADETCGDGVDQDCDGAVDEDCAT